MGDPIPLKTRAARRPGETVYTERGLRLPDRAKPAKALWFGASLAMMSVGAFLIICFW